MPQIHPTAVVEPGAQIGAGVVIGPMCYIGAGARIGVGCRLISHVSVLGRTTVGEGNLIWPQVTLGADPQDLKFHGEETELVIGDHNQIRELVTMHLGTGNGGGVTRVGSHNLIMVGAHVAHDCVVGDRVIIANNVALAGHIHVEEHANIGGAVAAHHFVTFGRHSFVGGMSRIVHDVPPFMIVEGDPAAVRGVNVIGLARRGFSADAIDKLKEAHRRLYRRGEGGNGANMAQRLTELESEFASDEPVMTLVRFLRNAAAGVYGRYRESQRGDSRRGVPASPAPQPSPAP